MFARPCHPNGNALRARCRFARASPKLRVVSDPQNGLGHRGPFGGGEKAALTVLDELGVPSDAGGDDRHTCEHRLEEEVGESLVGRGENEDVARAQMERHRLGIERPGQLDGAPELRGFDSSAKVFLAGALAHDEEARLGVPGYDVRHRIDDRFETFPGHHPPRGDENGVALETERVPRVLTRRENSFRKSGGVVDDVDFLGSDAPPRNDTLEKAARRYDACGALRHEPLHRPQALHQTGISFGLKGFDFVLDEAALAPDLPGEIAHDLDDVGLCSREPRQGCGETGAHGILEISHRIPAKRSPGGPEEGRVAHRQRARPRNPRDGEGYVASRGVPVGNHFDRRARVQKLASYAIHVSGRPSDVWREDTRGENHLHGSEKLLVELGDLLRHHVPAIAGADQRESRVREPLCESIVR